MEKFMNKSYILYVLLLAPSFPAFAMELNLLGSEINNNSSEQAARERDSNLANQANEQWIQYNTRACGQCNAPVERNQSCNHMTCTKCSHEFCYVCGNQWGNFQTCPYFNHPPVIANNQRNG